MTNQEARIADNVERQSDLLNEDGTASTIVIGTLVEVELEDLKEVALASIPVIVKAFDITETQALERVERTFRLYGATAHYLLLDTVKVEGQDDSLNLIRELTRVLLVEEAQEFELDFDLIESLIKKVVTLSTERAAEFILSDHFREYYDSLPAA